MISYKKIFIVSMLIFTMLLTACSSVDTVIGTTWHHEFINCTIHFSEDGTLTLYDISEIPGVHNGEEVVTTSVYVTEGYYTWNSEDGAGYYDFYQDTTVGFLGDIFIVDNEVVLETDGTMYTFMEQGEIPNEEFIVEK